MIRYAVLLALIHLGGHLPLRALYALSWIAGTLYWHASPNVRKVTRDHAQHVLGVGTPSHQMDAVARGCVRTAMHYYADFARLSKTPPSEVFNSFDEVHGLDALYAAIESGSGAILVSGHVGNGEFLAPATAPFGLHLAVVTEPLAPRQVHDLVHRVRQARGVRFLPATGTGLRDAYRHLKEGGTLGLLVDRDVLGTAREYPFFGEPAAIPSGAVDLALRTGAPMFAAWVPRTGVGRYALHLQPIDLPAPSGNHDADVEAGMATMIAAIEAGIRRWPDQWFVLTPIWREHPGGAVTTTEHNS
ncbi:MAG: hypothetical protein DWG82_03950 [Chloroflexi bacterium]|nr:hypothetical protein [Chloroflexota bacterium]